MYFNKWACYNFMDAVWRRDTPGSNTKDFITQHNKQRRHLFKPVCPVLTPSPLGVMQSGPVDPGCAQSFSHTQRHLCLGKHSLLKCYVSRYALCLGERHHLYSLGQGINLPCAPQRLCLCFLRLFPVQMSLTSYPRTKAFSASAYKICRTMRALWEIIYW